MRFSSIICRLLILSLVIVMSSVPALAKDYVTSIFLILNDGSPITSAQDLRFSLWSDGRYVSGDVDGAGAINTGAAHYSGYQSGLTLTPDALGRLRIGLHTLPDFPQITPENQFLMVEYKEDLAPDTEYTMYTDTYIDGTELERFPLVENGPDIYRSLVTNFATTSDTFVLDENNDATDVTLQFGDVLSESLRWNDAQDYFELSDDLVVDGNVNLNGTTIRLDWDESGDPDQDLEIIAGQGSETAGVIRFDDGDNRWEIAEQGLLVENTGTGSSFRVDDMLNDTTPFIIDAAGLVGIGTDTPAESLHVVGNIQFDAELNFSAFDSSRPTTIIDPGDLPADIDGYLIVDSSGNVEKMQSNEGVVKINGDVNGKPTFTTDAGVEYQIIYTSPLTVSSSTDWPESAPADEDSFYDFNTDKFLENPVQFQSHLFRIIVDYSGFTVGGTDKIILRLYNPLSGFEIVDTADVPKGFTFGTAYFNLWTIADTASIGLGYELYLSATDDAFLEVDSVTRFSFHKD